MLVRRRTERLEGHAHSFLGSGALADSVRHMRSVELFAGGGGLALGIHLAGFSTELVAEWDRWACDTLRENQAAGYHLVVGADVREGDIRAIDWSVVPEGIDLVSGGPPCQPFSAGGRGSTANDPRDMFPATAEVMRQLRPRAFIIENALRADPQRVHGLLQLYSTSAGAPGAYLPEWRVLGRPLFASPALAQIL